MLAHKTHFVVDGGRANIITAVEVRPACEGDSQVVGRMLDKHRVALHRAPGELVGERGYGSEAAFKACLRRDVQPTLATHFVRALGASPRFFKAEVMAQAQELLEAEEAERHRRVVIVVDEARLFSAVQLEELRLLTNSETPRGGRSPLA